MRQPKHTEEEVKSRSSKGEPVRSYSQETGKNSYQNSFSNYGNQLMRPIPGSDQDRVYERQEKAFNIINCYPREYPNVHRKYPKLTQ